MEDLINTLEGTVLAYVYVLNYVKDSFLLSNGAKLIEMKDYFINTVEASNTEDSFLEAIEIVIDKLEMAEESVPDFFIDLKAFVEVNYK